VIGRTISHYKILEKLGGGAMGVDYRAEDTTLKTSVAIKFLPPELTRDGDAKKRFIHEAQAAAALQHNNICTIHEIDETSDGHMFICMDYYEGETLKQKIARGPLPIAEALDIASGIAQGLAKAHDAPMVHRDIKPANIMVTSDGVVKIVDFGLAKLAGQTRMTKTGTTVGTVAYMSPEQSCGESIDHRTDIWSLGVVIYEMLTGRLPFRSDHEQAMTYRIVHEEQEPITALRTGVPMALERIVGKCLEKKASDRYQHIDDLIVDLRRVEKTQEARPKKRLFRYALPALGVIVVAALFFIIERKKDGPAVAAENTIGVIGFENLSDPEDREHLGRMLMGLITTDLTESGGLNVVSTSKVLASYKGAGGNLEGAFDASLAAETAKRAGARTMLAGHVIRSGDKLLLAAELVDVETGSTLGSLKREATSSAELFRLAGAMATDVRNRVGLPRKASGVGAFDLAESLTDSPEAYRQFVAGEVALHQQNFGEAVNRFRLAIKQDSTFALAWYRLSMALGWQGDQVASLTASDQALRYLDKLPQRWQVLFKAGNDIKLGNVDAGYAALSELITTGATDMPDAYYRLGEIASHNSRYGDAQKARAYFEKALEIDPAFQVVFSHLIDDYLVAGDVDAAERLIARYGEGDPLSIVGAKNQLLHHQQEYEEVITRVEEQMLRGNMRGWGYLAYALAEHRGEWDRALALADDAIRREVQEMRSSAIAYRASIHCARGRFRAAIADYCEAAAWYASAGDAAVATEANWYHLDRANLLVLTGDVEGALAAIREAKKNDRFEPRPYFELGQLLLDAGRRDEADAAFNELRVMSAESFSPWAQYWLHVFEADMHRADGNSERALSELEKASGLRWRGSHDRAEAEFIVRARVLEDRGDRSGAIAAYRGVLKPPHWGLWSPRMIAVHYDLGRLLEEEGDVTAAREHYATYVDCWGNADMPIANVETAKTRLRALETH